MTRTVSESPLRQGPSEQVSYEFDWVAIGTPSTAGVVTIIDKAGADMTSTNITGSPSLTTTVVTTGLVKSLTAKGKYTLRSLVTIGSRLLSAILEIDVDAY